MSDSSDEETPRVVSSRGNLQNLFKMLGYGIGGFGLIFYLCYLNGEAVDAFSAIVHRDKAYAYGVMMTGKLRELIPRQQFEA